MLVREVGAVVEILRDQTQLAVHPRCASQHQTCIVAAHHADIPTSGAKTGKARLSLQAGTPEVEVRSLSAYAALEDDRRYDAERSPDRAP